MSAVQLAAYGPSLGQLQEWEVTGSTYDPDGGSVRGMAGLDRNLEVGGCLAGCLGGWLAGCLQVVCVPDVGKAACLPA